MLSAGLIFLILYVLVPVALAWLIVRVDLRTIAKAYGIWIGLLVVVFVLPSSRSFSEGVGWALIFAMFCTAPAIPVLCLFINIWTRAGDLFSAAAWKPVFNGWSK